MCASTVSYRLLCPEVDSSSRMKNRYWRSAGSSPTGPLACWHRNCSYRQRTDFPRFARCDVAQASGDQLRRILAQEVAVHRDLLALARTRHILLKQGRFDEAAELAVREAACIVTLRELETSRSRLRRMATPHRTPARPTRQIASLVRSLAAVERATRQLWHKRVSTDGVHVLVPMSGPLYIN